MQKVLSAVLLFAILVPIASCRKETEQDRVRKVITAVQKAAEDKKILAVQEHISRSYGDPQGHDFDGIKGLLTFYFFRHKSVAVYLSGLDISVDGPKATAKFQALLTAKGLPGEEAGIILPDALGAYDFEVLLLIENGKWMVVSATWERTGEQRAP